MNISPVVKATIVGGLAFAYTITAFAGDDAKIAAEVMAAARAQWAVEMAGGPIADEMATVADDYTEFNADYPVRLDGKAANAKLYAATELDGTKPVAAEMMNPKVQVYGDVAILTYSYTGVNQTKDGKTKASTGKSTRVYARQNGQWKLVHAHFSSVEIPKD
ncbi:MAG: nuclear transport factor 2 family protein [Steroidobacteraceae bacterium]